MASAEYKIRVCCLLAVAYFSLGIFKNVFDELHFTSVNKLGISYTEKNNYIQNSITKINSKYLYSI